MVAVANTYANARKAADALKITYDNGPNAKLSSQSLIDEAKRLQALDDSGQFFVKDGDTEKAVDAVSGQPAKLPDDAEDVINNNRMRGELEAAMAALSLLAPDRAARARATDTLRA